MIVVVGLAFEARIAAGPGMQVICSGGGQNLKGTISRAITQGCGGLISFGVAGGIAPGLKPGTCVIASGVLSDSGHVATDPQWSQRLLTALPNPVHGTLLGVDSVVADVHTKRELHLKTGAVAVDMESHVVADAAVAHGIPLAAIRVITDPAARGIPSSALSATRADGTVDVMSVVRAVLRRPRELADLMRIALDTRAARATLRQGRKVLGPRLGLPEAGGTEAEHGEHVGPIGYRRPHGMAPSFSTYVPAGAFQSAE